MNDFQVAKEVKRFDGRNLLEETGMINILGV